jgi:hypothetical protein
MLIAAVDLWRNLLIPAEIVRAASPSTTDLPPLDPGK